MQRIVGTILFCCLSAAGIAQQRLSLQDAIARALEYNFDIRIAKVAAQQADVNNTAGNAGMLPWIDGNAGLTGGSANTHIEFADGRVQEVNNAATLGYNASLDLNWTLFDGGRMFIAKKRLSELEALGDVQLKAQIQTTISQVIQAYAQAVFQKQRRVAIDTGLALAQVRMIISQVKFETGSSAKVDYLQARVDLNTRRADSLAQLINQTLAFTELNVLMGEDPEKTYITDDTLTLNAMLQPKDSDVLKNMNLGLDAARRSVDLSKLDAKIARAEMLPTLALNGRYGYTNTRSQAGFALFNSSNGPSGGLNLNVPIFRGGTLRTRAKVASLESFRYELMYERQNTETGRQYRNAWRNYEVSVAAYELEVENIGYAEENKNIQQARFRVGIATTLEIREAENSYVEALVRLYTAAYNLKVNETKVLELESALIK